MFRSGSGVAVGARKSRCRMVKPACHKNPSRLTAMQRALVRDHHWLAMLESGEVKTLRELAVREGVDNSHVSRMINLTMLSPYVVAAILDDTLPDNITLLELAADPPLVWG